MSLTSVLDPEWDATLDELVEVKRDRAREVVREAQPLARLDAKTSRDGRQSQEPYESLVMEVAGSCLIGQNAASERIDQAAHLVRNLPVVAEEMQAGRVLLPQARVLIDETRSLKLGGVRRGLVADSAGGARADVRAAAQEAAGADPDDRLRRSCPSGREGPAGEGGSPHSRAASL
jgi:hypothetical protein